MFQPPDGGIRNLKVDQLLKFCFHRCKNPPPGLGAQANRYFTASMRENEINKFGRALAAKKDGKMPHQLEGLESGSSLVATKKEPFGMVRAFAKMQLGAGILFSKMRDAGGG